jgi:carbamoyl-phosphate synthase small subunit
VRSLGDWLKESGVPAIEGVDTRSLVQKLRSHGTMQGALLDEATDPAVGIASAPGIAMRDAVSLVAPHSIVELPGGAGPTILVIDTGAKESIMRSLRCEAPRWCGPGRARTGSRICRASMECC